MVSDRQDVLLAAAAAFDDAPADWAMFLGAEAPEGTDLVVAEAGSAIPGAICFDPSRPDALLPQIQARIKKPDVIAVTSACGGSGVTSVALHLALALAQTSHGVFVVESNRDCGVVERAAIDRGSVPTWEGVTSADEVSSRIITVPGGLRLLAAPEDDDGCKTVIEACAHLGPTVIDATTTLLSGLHAATRVVALLPPTVPGAVRTRRLIESHPSLTWAPVVNRLGRGGETTRLQLASLLGCSPTIELPCTPALRDAEDLGHLLSGQRTRFARRVRVLTAALTA